MPTPMPGSPEDEIYVQPALFKELAENFSDKRVDDYEIFVLTILDRLGREIVPIVRRYTPKSTGKLARSTRHRILTRIDEGGEKGYDLQIIQQATSNPLRGVSRYFYWLSLHHGLYPSGTLGPLHAPPPINNLLPWVQATLVTDPKRGGDRGAARRIALKLMREGTDPNPYLYEALLEAQPLLDDAAREIGQAIAVDLTRLPGQPFDIEE